MLSASLVGSVEHSVVPTSDQGQQRHREPWWKWRISDPIPGPSNQKLWGRDQDIFENFCREFLDTLKFIFGTQKATKQLCPISLLDRGSPGKSSTHTTPHHTVTVQTVEKLQNTKHFVGIGTVREFTLKLFCFFK